MGERHAVEQALAPGGAEGSLAEPEAVPSSPDGAPESPGGSGAYVLDTVTGKVVDREAEAHTKSE